MFSKTKIKIGLRQARGSFCKDPLFCLTVSSIIIVFILICFGLHSFPESKQNFLKAELAETHNLIFAESAKNFAIGFPSMAISGGNSIIAVAPPVTVNTQVLGGLFTVDTEDRKEIIEYVVQKRETFASIAEKYGISVKTILTANNLTSKSKIKEGQKLLILPVDGAMYFVEKGDTLSDIAKAYKGDIAQIIDFNGLSGEGDIFVGDILIIPGGIMPANPKSYVSNQVPLGSSYFICPHINCSITQGLHWFNAVDFGGKCGDPVYAAAAGIVQRVTYGWNGGGGNNIRIEHPNGVVTYYGHIQKALVAVGQQVSQGDILGLMGGKPGTPGAGISTGCHVHFDVRSAKNPFAK